MNLNINFDWQVYRKSSRHHMFAVIVVTRLLLRKDIWGHKHKRLYYLHLSLLFKTDFF